MPRFGGVFIACKFALDAKYFLPIMQINPPPFTGLRRQTPSLGIGDGETSVGGLAGAVVRTVPAQAFF